MNDNPKPESFKPDTVAEECQKELDTLKAENQALKEQLSTALAVAVQTAADRQQVQAELDRTLAKLAEKDPPAIEQPAIDLSDKAGEVASYLKTLLCDEKLLNSTLTKIKRNKPVSLPREVMSKIEGILSGDDKKTPTDARELLNEG